MIFEEALVIVDALFTLAGRRHGRLGYDAAGHGANERHAAAGPGYAGQLSARRHQGHPPPPHADFGGGCVGRNSVNSGLIFRSVPADCPQRPDVLVCAEENQARGHSQGHGAGGTGAEARGHVGV